MTGAPIALTLGVHSNSTKMAEWFHCFGCISGRVGRVPLPFSSPCCYVLGVSYPIGGSAMESGISRFLNGPSVSGQKSARCWRFIDFWAEVRWAYDDWLLLLGGGKNFLFMKRSSPLRMEPAPPSSLQLFYVSCCKVLKEAILSSKLTGQSVCLPRWYLFIYIMYHWDLCHYVQYVPCSFMRSNQNGHSCFMWGDRWSV